MAESYTLALNDSKNSTASTTLDDVKYTIGTARFMCQGPVDPDQMGITGRQPLHKLIAACLLGFRASFGDTYEVQ